MPHDQHQPAVGKRLQQRLEGLGIGGKCFVLRRGESDIALHPRHQPLQPRGVFMRSLAGQQPVRAGVGGRVIARLQRQVNHDLMAGDARRLTQLATSFGIRRKAERHVFRQADGAFGGSFILAEACDDDGDHRQAAFAFVGFRVIAPWLGAVGSRPSAAGRRVDFSDQRRR